MGIYQLNVPIHDGLLDSGRGTYHVSALHISERLECSRPEASSWYLHLIVHPPLFSIFEGRRLAGTFNLRKIMTPVVCRHFPGGTPWFYLKRETTLWWSAQLNAPKQHSLYLDHSVMESATSYDGLSATR